MPVVDFAEHHRKIIAFLYLVVGPVAIAVVLAITVSDHFSHRGELERLAGEGAEAHAAICVFRADLEQRVRSGRDFLADHPAGFAGIPAATLRASLANEQQTVSALSGLNCQKGASP